MKQLVFYYVLFENCICMKTEMFIIIIALCLIFFSQNTPKYINRKHPEKTYF